MKSGGGKSKGSGYEREIAKNLTKWVTGSDKPYIFWRSPSSGALQTISSAVNASGDIISIREDGKFFTDIFSIEVKVGYPKADFFQHFKDVKNDIIKEFWIQCVNDANKSNKYGMLIFKKNGLKPIIGIDENIYKYIDKYVKNLKSFKIIYDDNTPSIIFYDMEIFFKNITPKIIKKISPRG